MKESRPIQRENRYVLDVVQALLGLISTQVIAIALKVNDSDVLLRFWIHDGSDDIQQDADDVVFELEALLPPDENPEIRTEIIEGAPRTNPRDMGRVAFWAKDNDGRQV